MESYGRSGVVLFVSIKSSSINLRRGLSPSWKHGSSNLRFGEYVSVGRLCVKRSYIRPDSNAESVGPRGFKFKFRDKDRKVKGEEFSEEEGGGGEGSKTKGKKREWWSNEPTSYVEEQQPGILEEAFDNLWIFKVLRPYGWALPPILLSLLLADGPKAFLLASSFPLGLSVVVLVFEKLSGKTKRKPKRKAKKRTKPFVGRVSDTDVEEEVAEKQRDVRKKMGYQSWVVSDNGSVNTDGIKSQDEPNFRGWDELEYMQRSSPTTDQSQRKPLENGKMGTRGIEIEANGRMDMGGKRGEENGRMGMGRERGEENGRMSMGSRESEMGMRRKRGEENGRMGVGRRVSEMGMGRKRGEENGGMGMGRRESEMGMGSKRGGKNGGMSVGRRESEMPLLLRLLIAVFPFLASWTNLL